MRQQIFSLVIELRNILIQTGETVHWGDITSQTLPSKWSNGFVTVTTEKQIKQRARKLPGFVGTMESAITRRSTNGHQNFFASLLTFLYSSLDVRTSEKKWILWRNRILAMVGKVQSRETLLKMKKEDKNIL